MKNDLWFQKWYKEFGEFSHKYLKVMLDKSSGYVLAEMYFLAKVAHRISTFGFSTFNASTTFQTIFPSVL